MSAITNQIFNTGQFVNQLDMNDFYTSEIQKLISYFPESPAICNGLKYSLQNNTNVLSFTQGVVRFKDQSSIISDKTQVVFAPIDDVANITINCPVSSEQYYIVAILSQQKISDYIYSNSAVISTTAMTIVQINAQINPKLYVPIFTITNNNNQTYTIARDIHCAFNYATNYVQNGGINSINNSNQVHVGMNNDNSVLLGAYDDVNTGQQIQLGGIPSQTKPATFPQTNTANTFTQPNTFTQTVSFGSANDVQMLSTGLAGTVAGTNKFGIKFGWLNEQRLAYQVDNNPAVIKTLANYADVVATNDRITSITPIVEGGTFPLVDFNGKFWGNCAYTFTSYPNSDRQIFEFGMVDVPTNTYFQIPKKWQYYSSCLYTDNGQGAKSVGVVVNPDAYGNINLGIFFNGGGLAGGSVVISGGLS